MADWVVLGLAFGAGLLGGAMNALAGGGTFATMPTLIALGLPSPIANATSNIALLPGATASAWTYRDGLSPIAGISVWRLTGLTLIGGAIGASLLVATPTRVFDIVIPWLLLLATVALAAGRRGAEALSARMSIGKGTLSVMQVLLGAYGGYFGGAVGLMMVAVWGLLSGTEPHRLAAPRTLMLAVANMAAAIVFMTRGMISWEMFAPMALGAVAGGYLGALLGRALSAALIRGWTLFITAATTAVFFWRAYG